MTETPARTAARILIQTESVLFSPDDPFTFTSGRKSPVYVDCRRLISFPKERDTLMGMMADQIRETVDVKTIDAVAGGETAGIPFAAWIAERLVRPMIYVRKKPKGFGRNARIEGIVKEGDSILLIEDLATDGGSKMSFIEGIRDAGAECAHTFVVFHYGIFPDGIRKLAEAGVALHGLTTWWDIIECAEAEKILDADTVAKVTAFLKDPDGWKAPA
jgi:orotate phosphoribosyltransferase